MGGGSVYGDEVGLLCCPTTLWFKSWVWLLLTTTLEMAMLFSAVCIVPLPSPTLLRGKQKETHKW